MRSFIFVIQGLRAFPVLSCVPRGPGRWEQRSGLPLTAPSLWKEPLPTPGQESIPGYTCVMSWLRQTGPLGTEPGPADCPPASPQPGCNHTPASTRSPDHPRREFTILRLRSPPPPRARCVAPPYQHTSCPASASRRWLSSLCTGAAGSTGSRAGLTGAMQGLVWINPIC